MSYHAIAGALALADASTSERLVALSLASYANTEHRAYPGTRLAAVRAGMTRSQFVAAQGELAARGHMIVESEGGGRGKSQTVALTFAETGPWFEHGVNAPLLERVLSYTRLRGSARLLLAALAAAADEDGVVTGLSTDELCEATSLEDRTYRRARRALLASGEVWLTDAGGGRARTNEWLVRDPREGSDAPLRTRPERPSPPAGARPLMASAKPTPVASDADGEATSGDEVRELASPVKGPDLSGVSDDQPQHPREIRARKGPDLSGVSSDRPQPAPDGDASDDRSPDSLGIGRKNGPDLSGVSTDPTPRAAISHDRSPDSRGIRRKKGPDLSGVSEGAPSPETPAETPAQTPAPNARAGRESLNPLIRPPQPPASGGSGQIQIVEEYFTDKGRRRQRTVLLDVDQVPLSLPLDEHHARWRELRSELERIVGSSTFEIWLAALEFVGVSEHGELLLAAPSATAAWIRKRFGRALDRAGEAAGCRARLATDRERQLIDALSRVTSPPTHQPRQEAV